MAQDIRKDCVLEEVVYENENKKAILTFLDLENGVVLEVNFNKQKYDRDKGKFVNDKEKEEQVKEWCKEYFGCSFNELNNQVGTKKDIYVYDGFNSLWEVQITNKFDKDMVGQIIEGEITKIDDDGVAIRIFFNYQDKEYACNYNYSNFLEAQNKYFPNPQKKKKKLEKFEDTFHVPFSNREELLGKKVMVEVKLAFGSFVWNDIKPLPKK